jgi:hypothetical protein
MIIPQEGNPMQAVEAGGQEARGCRNWRTLATHPLPDLNALKQKRRPVGGVFLGLPPFSQTSLFL